MRVPCPLPSMNLCGHQLLWVDKILHLGNTLTNDTHIVNTDMNIKNARYIVKNIEINQEFYFPAAATRLKLTKYIIQAGLEASYGPSSAHQPSDSKAATIVAST